ncbi:MAG: YqaE/Pmp3 family membrane protein [Gammaproteobacteria bacterium]|nr:YqaE/Pmp3 family membrane protein [Gammaproteobacteria bacterium]
MMLLRVVATVLIPPLGVFLRHGLRRQFWLALLLTLVGYVPGVVYAVWTITR